MAADPPPTCPSEQHAGSRASAAPTAIGARLPEALRSVPHLLAIIDAAPTAKVMADANGRIVLANTAALRLFGYDRAAFLALAIEDLVPERFRSGHPGLRIGYAAAPAARPMGAGRDLFALRSDGTEFPVEIGLQPIAAEGGTFVLAGIVDLTERKRLESALRAANEELEARVRERTAQLEQAVRSLERSNLDLQQFAYIASHDLQSPLRSIAGLVQLLEAEYAGQLDERGREWLARVVASCKEMHRLIADLLEYSRLDAKPRAFEPVALEPLLEEALRILDPSLREDGATITSGPLPTVLGDRVQLLQVLSNLLGNALKYRSSLPPEIHVSAERGKGRWTIAVRDNGLGIEPRHHERVFEIFRRLHDSRAYPGSGIGLAICRRVVQRHRGRIWVESDGHSGSTFRFTIASEESP